MTQAPTLLATGFVADNPDEGTIFPSAGGNSADPKVQAIYWRCLTVFFASARITNPGQRLALFSNVTPPPVDGIDIADALERYGVELRRVPLTIRLATELTPMWGNVLYFFDILAALENEPDDLRFALSDSDVLVTGSLDPLFGLLDESEWAGLVIETAPDEPVNGLSRKQMGAIVASLGGPAEVPPHFGGELFATSIRSWKREAERFRTLLEGARGGTPSLSAVCTEEHIYTIAFAQLGDRVANADGLMRRIWTSPRFNTVRSGDERLPIWHLPAEKRYGFADLFRALARSGFPTAMNLAEFQALARRCCGIPAKSPVKFARDGVRQVAAKLGLRT